MFYSENLDLCNTGTFTYTVNVYLTMYPSCSGCYQQSSGTIIVVSPCLGPQITVGINIDIDFDFTGPVIWTPPPLTTVPTSCIPQIVYHCNFISGPYTGGYNMCGFVMYGGGYTTEISFDITTGIYVFNTDNTNLFPAGSYHFEIIIQIGDVSIPVPFTLTIIAHCDVPVLTVVN